MYKIKTLSSGYKVLCLDGVVAVDEIEDISAADFDAVYVEYGSISPTEIALILQKTSPFVSKKCRMKPRFISSRLKDRSLSFESVIDGYVTDINDPQISERIEGIQYNLPVWNSMRLPTYPATLSFYSSNYVNMHCLVI
ncbi:MAG: hypothetical protein II285_02000 [Flavobacteriales bacterium]|nr:hypothetical protein [Flavobacteriales bacterium]